jgi:PAS domain S-box-containing protein
LITGDVDSYNLEKRYICKDSSIIWVSLTVKVIRDYDSLPQWFVSVVEDISERRRTSEELAKSELRYRNLVDNSLVGVFNTSLDGEFLFVNDALVRIYEFDNPEQMLALGSMPRWGDPKQRARMVSKLQADGSVTNFEAETITHTGRHIFVLFSAKLQDELITGMVMDITDRKQAEQEILEYQQHLKALTSRVVLAEEQERRRIATDLHDNVSQTLALTRLQLATVAKSIDDAAITEQLDEISQTLRDSLRETRNLIFDLSSPTINELGLGDAIREWVERKISPYHDVVVKVIDEPGMDSHCEDHNALLLRNVRELLTNVVKHARADRATVHLEREGANLRVTVKDNGVGILQPELLKRNISQDGGLGLFSIEERLTDLGGVMAINSKVNHGTTIVMTVPCLESTQETAK